MFLKDWKLGLHGSDNLLIQLKFLLQVVDLNPTLWIPENYLFGR